MSEPLISILIPTRNRPALASLAVEAALSASDDDCEIIVADNSDAPLQLETHDARLRHLLPEGVLSMPDNWERALSAASGEWIMLLADKYMLVPGAVSLLRRLGRSGLELIAYGQARLRQHLGAGSIDGDLLRTQGGTLEWFQGLPARRVRDSSSSLRGLIAAAEYPRQYPMLYNAMARRSVVGRARLRTGRFFLGSCPDVASCLQLLGNTSAWLETHYPLVLVQYPSDQSEWSTGSSAEVEGDLSRRFFRELGCAIRPIERTVSGAVFATMRAYAPAFSQASLPWSEGWCSLARRVSWELDGKPSGRRPGMHVELLRYTQSERVRPSAAWAQLRALAGSFLPSFVRQAWMQARRGTVRADASPVAVENVLVRSRAEALETLSAVLLNAYESA